GSVEPERGALHRGEGVLHDALNGARRVPQPAELRLGLFDALQAAEALHQGGAGQRGGAGETGLHAALEQHAPLAGGLAEQRGLLGDAADLALGLLAIREDCDPDGSRHRGPPRTNAAASAHARTPNARRQTRTGTRTASSGWRHRTPPSPQPSVGLAVAFSRLGCRLDAEVVIALVVVLVGERLSDLRLAHRHDRLLRVGVVLAAALG